jgi:DNA polymerase-3 subunit alpha
MNAGSETEAGLTGASPPFVHLHVHSHNSFLSSTIKVADLVKRAKAENMPAVALTDINNVFGAIEFYFACKDAGIKPIIGCDLVYSPEGRDQVFEKKKPLHSLVVLCKDMTGYKNLSLLLTRAFIDGANNKTPLSDLVRGVVDRELLQQHGDGLIVLSSSIRGEIGHHLLQGNEDEAVKAIEWFRKRFGEDFFLEVVDNGLPEQESVNQRLAELGPRMGV